MLFLLFFKDLFVNLSLKQIYAFFVQEGMKSELRSKKQVDHFLAAKRKVYKKLKVTEKKFFDKEALTNPYADTRILHGDESQKIINIMVGIDIGVSEILLAQELVRQGTSIDLVLSHHPSGLGLAGLYDVMLLQADVLENLGIEDSIAQRLMKTRVDEVARSVHGANHNRVLDAARILNIPFMCCHTPADNHVAKYLQKTFDAKKPKTLKNVVNLLLKEPEYRQAQQILAGPKIVGGKPDDLAGKIFVDMTGGTSGSKEAFARLSQIGIKTQVAMHASEAAYKKMKAEHIALIVAGHIASDNLGMNLILDKLCKKGNINIFECSGFRRFKR